MSTTAGSPDLRFLHPCPNNSWPVVVETTSLIAGVGVDLGAEAARYLAPATTYLVHGDHWIPLYDAEAYYTLVGQDHDRHYHHPIR